MDTKSKPTQKGIRFLGILLAIMVCAVSLFSINIALANPSLLRMLVLGTQPGVIPINNTGTYTDLPYANPVNNPSDPLVLLAGQTVDKDTGTVSENELTEGADTLEDVYDNYRNKYLLGVASDFSVYLRNNFTVRDSDAEGRVAVGGAINIWNPWYSYSIGAGDYTKKVELDKLLVDEDGNSNRSGAAFAIIGGNDINTIKEKTLSGNIKSSGYTNYYIDGQLTDVYYKSGTKYGEDPKQSWDECDDYPHVANPTVKSDRKLVINTDDATEISKLKTSLTKTVTDTDSSHSPLPTMSQAARWDKVDQRQSYATKIIDFDDSFDNTLIQRSHALLEAENEFKITTSGTDIIFTYNKDYLNDGDTVYATITDYDTYKKWRNAGTVRFVDVPNLAEPRTVYDIDGSRKTWNYKYIVVTVSIKPSSFDSGHEVIKVANPSVNGGSKVTSVNGHTISKSLTDTFGEKGYNNHIGVSSLLYNFPTAEYVILGGNFQGTILAPKAFVTDFETLNTSTYNKTQYPFLLNKDNSSDSCGTSCTHGHLSGALIADSFDGTTEFGYRPFNGPITMVPEGSITIDKNVVDTLKDGIVEGETFTVVIEALAEDGVSVDTTFNGTYSGITFTNGRGTVTLKHNESITLENIPAGTEFRIKEDAQSSLGYESKVSASGLGTIEEAGDIEYVEVVQRQDEKIVINNIELIPTTTAIKEEKVLSGRDWKDSDSFTFEFYLDSAIYKADGKDIDVSKYVLPSSSATQPIVKTISYSDITKQALIEPITFKVPGLYTFKVKEVIPDTAVKQADGIYKLDGVTYSNTVYTIQYNVVMKGDGTGELIASRAEGTAGVLDTTIINAEGNAYNNASTVSFENIYNISDTKNANIAVSKLLAGRDWIADDSFDFELKNISGDPDGYDIKWSGNTLSVSNSSTSLGNQTYNGASGVVKTAGKDTVAISFTKPDTYVFELKEITPDPLPSNSISYSNQIYTLTYNVSDAGNGTLDIVSSVSPDSLLDVSGDKYINFTNTYSLDSSSIEVGVEKKFIDEDGIEIEEWGGKEFTFSLTQNTDDEIQILEAPLSASITQDIASHKTIFPNITFTQPGIYHFTIKENVPDNVGNISYDTNSYPLTINVVDDLSGHLTVSREDGELPALFSFTNTTNSVLVSVPVTKVVKTYTAQGLEPYELKEGDFAFKVVPDKNNVGDPVPAQGFSVFNNSVIEKAGINQTTGHALLFADYEFTEVGTYRYYVSEINDNPIPGFDYDNTTWTIDITIAPDTEKPGKLTGTYTISNEGQEADDVVFTNIYYSGVSASVNARKQISGLEGLSLTTADFENEFQFTIVAKSSTPSGIEIPLPANTTISNDAQGNIAFGDINFTQPGTYVYEIKELSSTSKYRMVYDTDAIEVRIKVIADEDGVLKAETVYTNPAQSPENVSEVSNEAVFTNMLLHNVNVEIHKTQAVNISPSNYEISDVARVKLNGLDEKLSIVSYYLQVTNTEEDTADNVVVSDTLPTGLVIANVANAISDNGQYDDATRTITWDLGTLQGKEQRIVSFTAQTLEGYIEKYWKNQADVSYEDPFTSVLPKTKKSNAVEIAEDENISAPAKGNPELILHKEHALNYDEFTTEELIFEAGEETVISYKIVVSNIGDGKAENVVVRDNIPYGMTVIENTISHDGVLLTEENGIDTYIEWTLGTVEPNENIELMFDTYIPASDVFELQEYYKNVARISYTKYDEFSNPYDENTDSNEVVAGPYTDADLDPDGSFFGDPDSVKNPKEDEEPKAPQNPQDPQDPDDPGDDPDLDPDELPGDPYGTDPEPDPDPEPEPVDDPSHDLSDDPIDNNRDNEVEDDMIQNIEEVEITNTPQKIIIADEQRMFAPLTTLAKTGDIILFAGAVLVLISIGITGLILFIRKNRN